jgi:hypothetical protein
MECDEGNFEVLELTVCDSEEGYQSRKELHIWRKNR